MLIHQIAEKNVRNSEYRRWTNWPSFKPKILNNKKYLAKRFCINLAWILECNKQQVL